jgi:hypothetical protein
MVHVINKARSKSARFDFLIFDQINQRRPVGIKIYTDL